MSGRILIADDDRAIRESLSRALSLEGYDVIQAVDGAAALQSVESSQPDVAILDLMMPNLDGLTVCRVLRAERNRIPILMLTARTETPDRVAGLDAGADDYLPKPFDLDELLARVRALLRRVCYDLAGLPPSEAEVRAFLNDKSPDAFAKVVDRLLASPQYGERWGRFWLDVARYADTKGDPPNRNDARYAYAWTYRDYVINAFNTDKPYNQFILEQLAADLLISPPRPPLAATRPAQNAGRAGQGAPGRAGDRKSTRLNSSHIPLSRMPSSA